MRALGSGVLVCGVAVLLTRCGPSGPVGSAVNGATDTHCVETDGGAIIQETSPASCMPSGGMATPDTDGDTLYNASGSDDGCKYDVSWSATPIRKSSDVTFTLVVKSRVDSSAVGGADVGTDVFLSDSHPAPNTHVVTTEGPTGTYAVGPIELDASGQWTVRFVIFPHCDDTLEASPHGHVAFYVNVP